jgi:hypothetical protein
MSKCQCKFCSMNLLTPLPAPGGDAKREHSKAKRRESLDELAAQLTDSKGRED